MGISQESLPFILFSLEQKKRFYSDFHIITWKIKTPA